MPRFQFTAGDLDGSGLHGCGEEPGAGAAAAVCIVHGLGEHSGRYDWVMSTIAQAGMAAIAIDLRGHGRSPGQRGDAPSCSILLDDIDLLLATAAARYPEIPLYLYGHSFGGSLVLGYAIGRRAPAGAVVTSPLLVPAEAPPAWKRTAARMMSRLIPRMQMSTGLDSAALSRNPDVAAAYESDPLVHGAVTARLGHDILAFGRENLDRAGELDIPVLLMHGSSDSITSPVASGEFAERAGDRCSFVIWPGLYHELHREPEREQVIGHVLDWLEKNRRKSRVP
jgi:alpha-beta hydrolase superfamily lysophospholipase